MLECECTYQSMRYGETCMGEVTTHYSDLCPIHMHWAHIIIALYFPLYSLTPGNSLYREACIQLSAGGGNIMDIT